MRKLWKVIKYAIYTYLAAGLVITVGQVLALYV